MSPAALTPTSTGLPVAAAVPAAGPHPHRRMTSAPHPGGTDQDVNEGGGLR